MNKDIELELRAEIKDKDFNKITEKLKKIGECVSKTQRLSVMFFGKIGRNNFDIKIRITNGKAEIVIKKGSFHSHDRIEISQPIQKNQLIGMVKIFSQMGFVTKVCERETFNFNLGDRAVASLVKAKMISYIELEKMSSRSEVVENKVLLKKIADGLGVKIIQNSSQFNELCNRLDKKVDWDFSGSKKDYIKIEKLLENY